MAKTSSLKVFLRPGESYPLSPKPLPYGARSWALDMTTSRTTGCFATLLVECPFNCCTNVAVGRVSRTIFREPGIDNRELLLNREPREQTM